MFYKDLTLLHNAPEGRGKDVEEHVVPVVNPDAEMV